MVAGARGAASRRRWGLAAAGVAVMAALGAVVLAVASLDIPPRELGPALTHRAQGLPQPVQVAARHVAQALERMDRGERRGVVPVDWRVGAASSPPGVDAGPIAARADTVVPVDSPAALLKALPLARPGDVLELAPGTYRFDGADALLVDRPGTAGAPITVRARRHGEVVLEFALAEGFRVTAPHRRFENLTVRGVCAHHGSCEHAFHVVGGAHHVAIVNNRLEDFNAHIKVNGERGRFPDDGLVEGNTLVNASPRDTDTPVAPFDAVGVSRWTVRGNLIADFIKARGSRISFAAFAKGGGEDNRFERNVVLCEWKLLGAPGWRVGLSLGGGGTSFGEYCRDRACVLEQERGVIDSNLVAGCSDDGIYVNRSADSRIVHNTLIDTGGIVVRFPESSAQVEGNLTDGAIRARNGGLLHAADNVSVGMIALYAGRHAPRELFRDASMLDLRWRGPPARRATAAASPVDLCGATRPPAPAYGAFEDFAACLRPAATLPGPRP